MNDCVSKPLPSLLVSLRCEERGCVARRVRCLCWCCVQADVINRGFGGYFTSWIVDYMLDDLFNVANPTMAILFLGTKDTLTQAVSG